MVKKKRYLMRPSCKMEKERCLMKLGYIRKKEVLVVYRLKWEYAVIFLLDDKYLNTKFEYKITYKKIIRALIGWAEN